MERTVKICFLTTAGVLGLLSVFALGHIKGKSHYKNSLEKKERVKKTQKDKGGM